MKKKVIGYLIAATFVLLVVHLIIINKYTINWDYHHVFFAGLYHIDHPVTNTMWHHLPFVDPDPRRMVETPFGPLQSVLPAISFVTFFENLKILPFDSAWNLPAVVSGVLGVLILSLFLLESAGIIPAILGFLFLSFYPRYWGDLHTNVKDIPTAAMYTLSIFLAWRAVQKRKLIDIIIAGIACGITFNFKVNAIFIPIIIALWVLWLSLTKAKKKLAKPFKNLWDNIITPIGSYFLIACLSAYGIWAMFWDKPYDHLAFLIRFYQYNTLNLEVVLNGNWYCSGSTIPWYYPFWYLGAVTPVIILILFFTGLSVSLYKTFIKHTTLHPLLLLWFFVPLSRFMLPNTSTIDGIRHFEEVVFPMIAISALGAEFLWKKINKVFLRSASWRTQEKKLNKLIIHYSLFIILFIYLVYPIILYHPYQLSYFNELVGGARGAMGKYDLDYWGISQKEAVEWVNENAPLNSLVHIVMTADTSGKYLRPDLLARLNTAGYDRSDYVILLNRQSFFYRFFYSWEYWRYHEPVYTVYANGAPLSWVYDNKKPLVAPPKDVFYTGEDPCIRKYW
ncbi:glycosyltransferase family 39 protein [Patescibacteria group bacterium]